MMKKQTTRISWYANRLLSMGPGEIVYRLRNQLTLWQERSAVRRPDHSYPPSPIPPGLFPAFKENGLAQFFYDNKHSAVLRQQIQDQFPDGVNASLEAAEQLLKGQITLFGRPLQLDRPIQWSKDPLTGKVWPLDFWAAVDIRDGQNIGGVKWVRELNRHHHFVTLGKAYWLTGDERFAKALCGQFSAWIDQNLPYIGVNWSSALGNAIRVINWLWALNFIHASPALTEPLFGRILSALAAQTAFINNHLSKFSSANNHLIGEAAGLAFVALHLPWLPQADKWREIGMEILTAELTKQIHPDGVPAEQAINYLAFDLDFYLLIWQSAIQRKIPIPPVWHTQIEAACHFINHIMDQKGRVPALGDSDDGRVVALDERPAANSFHSILASAAVLLQQPELKAQAVPWDEKSHWLLGEKGQQQFQALESRPSNLKSKAFKDGGYCLMRHDDTILLFDCGPLGYLSLAAHGHADALSLVLTAGNEPILIDPGTYAYREGGQWRRYFRGTSAHNTIVIDGQDQSEMKGDFLWGRRAETKLLEWESSNELDRCTAEHNGYAALNITHRRTLLFHKPDLIIVHDSLIGQGAHHIAQNWHFPINAQIAKMNGHFVLKVNETTVQILPETTTALTPNIRQGETNPIQGWVSNQYSHKSPAPVLTLSGTCPLPLQITTLINVGPQLETAELTALRDKYQQAKTI